MIKKGCFITIEGIDGCGKSTQIQLLKEHIESDYGSCYQTLEPSDGSIGCLLRQYLSGNKKTDEYTMAALFAADRLDHIQNETDGMLQKINHGTHVICDRYVLSNYAYQGVSTDLQWVKALNSQALRILKPDCHIFIDIDPSISMERVSKNRPHFDLYESLDRLTAVRKCYLKLIEELREEENIIIINGNQRIEQVEDDIWLQIAPIIKKKCQNNYE